MSAFEKKAGLIESLKVMCKVCTYFVPTLRLFLKLTGRVLKFGTNFDDPAERGGHFKGRRFTTNDHVILGCLDISLFTFRPDPYAPAQDGGAKNRNFKSQDLDQDHG